MVKMVAAAALVVTIGAGCGDGARPMNPSSTFGFPVAPSPLPPPPALPPLSGAATTYRFSDPLDYGVSPFTERSSIVLYESGGCYLQYDDISGQLRGRYDREAEEVRFYFGEDNSGVDATGIVRGDFLDVRYSLIMQHSDFENARYRLVK